MNLNRLPMLLALSVLPCSGGESEVHLSTLRQEAPARGGLPAKDFRILSLTYVYEPDGEPRGPVPQLYVSVTGESSDSVRSTVPGNDSSYKPGGSGSIGMRLLSRGALRAGVSLEMRLGSEQTGPGSSSRSLYARSWGSVIVQYQLSTARFSPLFSLSYGFTASPTPGSATRELGTALAIRF